MRICMVKKILLAVAALLFIISCATYDTNLGDDWTEDQFFTKAQQASDRKNLSEALFYYEVFLLRYPQNNTKGIAAEYERAYIFYQKKDYDLSETYLQAILDKYDNSPYSYLYPQAYRILSEKVMEKIEEKKAIAELPFFQRGKARKYGLESLNKNQIN